MPWASPGILAAPEKAKKNDLAARAAAGGSAPVMSAERIIQESPGEFHLTGDVDFQYGTARLFADDIRYSDASRTVTAEGNVVIQFEANQISGDRVEVNLESGYASIDNARGYFEPDVIMEAERIERLGENTFKITKGRFTTCTQPTPYWSFGLSSGIIELGSYARMVNAAFSFGRVPVFYSPYLVWPIKEERSPGLLLPHIGFTSKRGPFISNALYFPLGRSMDATFQFDFFNGRVSTDVEQLPQAGQGLEFRYVPSEHGSGLLTGYFLRERFRTFPSLEEQERDRYRLTLSHTQRLPMDFRLLADVTTVSDLDYFLDFEREIRASSSPTVLSQLELSRQTGPMALNIRFNRQLQFLAVDAGTGDTEDLTLWRLPEIELRGRGIRIGRSRFYLNFASSFDGFGRRTRTINSTESIESVEAAWTRFDVAPTISGNFTPVPWLDLSPRISFRETYYSASDADPGPDLDPEDDAFERRSWSFGMSAVGPRLYRLYGGKRPDATQYKHTFEPRLSYSFAPEVTGGEKIIPFDEIDVTPPSTNVMSYSLTSRLFAKRTDRNRIDVPPPALNATFASLVTGETAPTRYETTPTAPVGPDAPAPDVESSGEPSGKVAPDLAATTTYVAPEISTGSVRKAMKQETVEADKSGVGPVEIATFDLTQRFSFDQNKPLSISNALDIESAFGPVLATLRFNPSRAASLDMGTEFDILFHEIRSVSLSGNLRTKNLNYLRLSWFLNRDLEGVSAASNASCAESPSGVTGRGGFDPGRCYNDTSQIRLLGGVATGGRKLTLDVEGNYDVQESFFRDQRYRFGWNTQCCGVMVEVSRRFFQTSSLGDTSETEFRFVLNLRGVGTFLDLNGRPQ
jgi:LPS-assembly protein